MKKKETHLFPSDAEVQALYEEIMERERNDKRPFLAIAFDFQTKYHWESSNSDLLSRSPVHYSLAARLGGAPCKEMFWVVQVVSPHPLSKRVPVREAVFLVFNVDIPPASQPSSPRSGIRDILVDSLLPLSSRLSTRNLSARRAHRPLVNQQGGGVSSGCS